MPSGSIQKSKRRLAFLYFHDIFWGKQPYMLRKNIIIQADPRTGKSTLLCTILKSYTKPKTGLVTSEILNNSERVGFKMGMYSDIDETPFFGSVIAHVNLESPIQVSKYKVNDDAVRMEALPLWRDPIRQDHLLYLDKIGEMQLCSETFLKLTEKYLDAPNTFIGTLSAVCTHSLVTSITKRTDVILIQLTKENREHELGFIQELIPKIEKARSYSLHPELFLREGPNVVFNSDHGARTMNLVGKTCTCDFYKKYPEHHVCSHLIAAEFLFEPQTTKR